MASPPARSMQKAFLENLSLALPATALLTLLRIALVGAATPALVAMVLAAAVGWSVSLAAFRYSAAASCAETLRVLRDDIERLRS